jgi:hypothetical protein
LAALTTSGEMARNVSQMSKLYTVSAISGPLLAGTAMKATHPDALMWFAAAALVMLGGLLRLAYAKVQPAI